MHNPPADVVDVIIALGVVMSVEPELVRNSEGKHEEHYFENTRRSCADPKFFREIQELDVDNLPQSTVAKIDFFLERPNFRPDALMRINRPAAMICNWIRLIANYLDMRKEIFAEFPQFKQGRHPKQSHYEAAFDADSDSLDASDSDEDFKPSTKDLFKRSHTKNYAQVSDALEFDDEMGELFERVAPG